jgi:serine/threonine protein phosphatase PrpC
MTLVDRSLRAFVWPPLRMHSAEVVNAYLAKHGLQTHVQAALQHVVNEQSSEPLLVFSKFFAAKHAETVKTSCGEEDIGVSAGVCTRQGTRSYMEDRALACALAPGLLYAAVFDGHVGDAAAEYCAQELHHAVRSRLGDATNDDALEAALEGAFESTNAAFLAATAPDEVAGTTACVLLRVSHADTLSVHAANAGDSRAVLCLAHAGGAVSGTHAVEQLTRDHKPDDPDETTRIEAAGGSIWDMEDGCGGRVVGPDNVSMLQVARSLGSLPPCLHLPACMCSPRRLRLPTGGT